MSHCEAKAIEVGNDRKELRKRLNDARAVLVRELRQKFRQVRFDFAGKRLIGDGYALQWTLRPFPGQPESYHNQQTSRGMVAVVAIGSNA